MNPLIITVIISTAAFIVTLFASSYLNQRAMENQTRTLEKLLDTKIDALRNEMLGEFKEFRSEIRGELKTIDARLDHLERRVGRIEDQLNLLFVPALPRTGTKSGD